MLDIIHAIQQWIPGQPRWQGEALRRLYVNRALTAHDENELYGLIKSLQGIHCDEVAVVQPWGLVGDAVQVGSEHIVLTAITDVRYANALASDQRIEFEAAGLTVIYGDNGSGKSGYARVLKRACRARDTGETILPDVNSPAPSNVRASARFHVRADGDDREVLWRDGGDSPAELLGLVVFDSRCAQNYLATRGASTFVPEGMDLMTELVALCDRMRIRLKEELRTTVVDKVAYAHLVGKPTAVGRALAGLSGATSVGQLEALAHLDEGESADLVTLGKAVRESNPKEKAQVLRLQSRRLQGLAQRCEEQADLVSEEAVRALRQQVNDTLAATQAAASASDVLSLREGTLRGTGSEPWREMLRAARAFVSDMHAGHSLGQLTSEDACPLCQQRLGPAAERLATFDAFIEGAAEQAAQTARQTLASMRTAFTSHALSVGFDIDMQAEVSALDAPLREAVMLFEKQLVQRRDAVVAACTHGGDWTSVPPLPEPVAPKVSGLANALDQQADALEALADEKRVEAVQLRYAELSDRAALLAVLPAVIAAVRTEQLRARLAVCDFDVQTGSITQQAGVMNQRILTPLLAASLNAEFQALGVEDLRVELTSKNVKGTTQYGLTLQRHAPCTPHTVLSEGEQRAVAIAALLADLSLGGTRAGVIFDDPVSSLDHERRERVARRLVQESKVRQVIVLSHDLAFVSLLGREARLEGVPLLMQSLRRQGKTSGVKTQVAPVAGINVGKRVAALNGSCDDIERLVRAGALEEANEKLRCGWVDLRLAWERAVEECLFNGVVERFDPGVSTMQLDGVDFGDEEVRDVFRGMTRCNTTPHDQAARLNSAPPPVSELRQETARLRDWIGRVRERGKEARARRGLR